MFIKTNRSVTASDLKKEICFDEKAVGGYQPA
jgi:hypothetical protein